ncbi:FG-GAP repeat protein [Marispirochaeta aestuarii]|uniref:FG-GAP repeat protein n=1 Tax=Marispirochaeta aestuarii TaxID=1963862 RepID=UPI0029C6F010|nr:FG-GAP repeat protein [Marispirochaeta aestuarii]
MYLTKRFSILPWLFTGMMILTAFSSCAGAGAGKGENSGDGLSAPTWQQLSKFLGDAEPDDQRGWSVAIDGNTAIVGIPSDDVNGITNAGSAYIFVRDGAGTWTWANTLTASDAGEYDLFGVSVALSGDYAIVGAHHHNGPSDSPFAPDGKNIRSGAAYVFVRTSTSVWLEETKLIGERDWFQQEDHFGSSVAISGDTAVVGSPNDEYGDVNPDSGAVYVFRRDDEGNWPQETRLTAADASAGDNFGSSVAIDGDSLIIGAPFDDYRDYSSGSAYIFTREGGGWKQIKLSPDSRADHLFGLSVAIEKDTAIVGAPQGRDFRDVRTGSAYLFVKTDEGTWSLSDTLTPSGGAEGIVFGWSTAIAEDSIVIGAIGDGKNSSGSVYVFTNNDGESWTQSGKFFAADAAFNTWFGFGISISGQSVIIGAPNDNGGGYHSGAAYFFALR